MTEQALTGGRQGQPAAFALKKRGLHQIFQAFHLQAEGGLGDEHPFRRPQHRSRIHNGRETAVCSVGKFTTIIPPYEPGS